MATALDFVFSPKSVAVFGASSKPGSNGYIFTKELLTAGFPGKVYPINPKGGEIDGHRIFTSLDEINDTIDLALMLTSRENAARAVMECADHGVKAGVLYTAGFGEIGETGQAMQRDIVARAREKGMRLVGPNCMGIFSNPCHLNLTGEFIPGGSIGMISQSGNVGFSMWFEAAKYLKTGFSRFVGFGNQADIPVHEYLAYLRDDPETRVIIMYLEGLLPGMGQQFLEVARQTTKCKPVVIIKGGRGEAGSRAAVSHTGALAGQAEIYSVAFRQAGIVEVTRLDELLPVAQALLNCPDFKGDQLAVVGSGGGHMILSTDSAERNGFKVPPFSPATYERISERLPYFCPRANPLDMAGVFDNDLRLWTEITRLALAEPNIGGAFVYGMFGSYRPDRETYGETWESAARNVASLQEETGKPIVMFAMAGREDLPSIRILRQGGLPVFDSIDIAMRALRAVREYSQFKQNMTAVETPATRLGGVPAVLLKAAERPQRNLTEPEAYSLLADYEVPVVPHRLAASVSEAVEAAENYGYPVVMKLCSPDILHKSDFGGVQVGLLNGDMAKKAYRTIIDKVAALAPAASITGVLVSPQLGGVEVIAGIFRDPQFGPVLMAGLGGIFVEILKDVAFRILPVGQNDLYDMLKELKAYPLLTGVRGRKPVNLEALVKLLGGLSRMVLENPEIEEIDLNPIFVNETGAVTVDARIIVSK